MELTEALSKLNTRNVIARTQRRDRIDAFVYKTYDNKPVILDCYEREGNRWFVITTHAFIGWTTRSTVAFNITGNCSAFTLHEMAAVVNKAKRDTALPASVDRGNIEDWIG